MVEMDGESEQAPNEPENTTKPTEEPLPDKVEDDIITAPNPPSAEMVKGNFTSECANL